jgi:protein disulfide-isomerase A6
MSYKEKYLKYKAKYIDLKLKKQGGSNYKQLGGSNSKAKIILFKANWCIHCQTFLPEWKKLQAKYENKYEFITYDSDAHKEIASKYDVQGYPTIYIEKNNKTQEYKGKREGQEIINAIAKL